MTELVKPHGVRAYPSIDHAWHRLEEFLGDRFDESLTSFDECCRFVQDEFDRLGPDFYTHSVGYLYELTHFHFSTYKDAFFDVVTTTLDGLHLVDVGDIGCGVGLDAQALASRGCQVALYDLESPSTKYASWRFARDDKKMSSLQGINALGATQHDLVYAVDVLEHLHDPLPIVPRLFAAGRYVCVNFFEHDRTAWDGKDMHFPLNHWGLLPEFSRQGDLIQLAISGDTITTLWKGRS